MHYHNSVLFPSLPMPGSTMEIRLPTWEVLQETTARLLFMAVRWVRCLVPFQTLSKNDQQLLLQVKFNRFDFYNHNNKSIYFLIFQLMQFLPIILKISNEHVHEISLLQLYFRFLVLPQNAIPIIHIILIHSHPFMINKLFHSNRINNF